MDIFVRIVSAMTVVNSRALLLLSVSSINLTPFAICTLTSVWEEDSGCLSIANKYAVLSNFWYIYMPPVSVGLVQCRSLATFVSLVSSGVIIYSLSPSICSLIEHSSVQVFMQYYFSEFSCITT